MYDIPDGKERSPDNKIKEWEEEVRNGVRRERLIVLSQILFYYKHVSTSTTMPHLPLSDIVGGTPTLTVLIPMECAPTSNKKYEKKNG